ncbi:MAG: hypothetical protein ABSH39_12345 [Candidatus Acidiferrum sp.]|jgi:hypothetical protein
MNTQSRMSRWFGRAVAGAFALAMASTGAWGQDTSVTTIQHGAPSFETQVRNAEVIYVEGNDLVLKLENGRVEHLVVPDSDKFTIDGQEVTVHELVRGTKLTQSITTTTTPRYVNTVRTIEGKVWHVNAPSSVIVRLPDNTHQIYTVPNHAKFIVNGHPKTVFDLRKGMNIKATIVTDDAHTVIEQSKAVTGEAPIPQALPQEVGVLLFFPVAQPEAPTAAEKTELASTLPRTASLLPLAGLLGVLAVGLSIGLGTIRQAFKG